MRGNRSDLLAGLLLATLTPGQTEGEPRIEIVHEIPLDRRGAARLVHLTADELLLLTEIGVVESRSWPGLELRRREALQTRTRMHLREAIETGDFYWGTPRSRLDSVAFHPDTMEIVTLAGGELRRHRFLRGSFRSGLTVALSERATALRAEPDHGVSFVRPRLDEFGEETDDLERVWLGAALEERRVEIVDTAAPDPIEPPADTPAHDAAAVAFAVHGDAAVVARADGTLQVRHAGRWSTRDDVPLAPTRMQFTRDGRKLLVTSPTVWQVVDVDSGTSSWRTPPCDPRSVRGLFPGRVGGELLVVVGERIDLYHATVGRTVVRDFATLPAGHLPLAVDASGARMISSGERDHAILDLEANRVVTYPGRASAAAFRGHSVESWVWVQPAEFGPSSVERRAGDGELLDTVTVAVQRIFDGANFGSHVNSPPMIRVAPSGERFLLREQFSGVVAFPPLRAGVDPETCDDFAVFVDGERDVLLATGVVRLGFIDLATEATFGEAPRGTDESQWLLSPDGSRLASVDDDESVAVLRIRVVRDQ